MKNLLKNLWNVLTFPFVSLYMYFAGAKSSASTDAPVVTTPGDAVDAPVVTTPESAVTIQSASRKHLAMKDKSAVTSDKTMSFVLTLGLFAAPVAATMFSTFLSAEDNTGQCSANNHTLIGTF